MPLVTQIGQAGPIIGVGHNLRPLRTWLLAFLCALVTWLNAATQSSCSVSSAHEIG